MIIYTFSHNQALMYLNVTSCDQHQVAHDCAIERKCYMFLKYFYKVKMWKVWLEVYWARFTWKHWIKSHVTIWPKKSLFYFVSRNRKKTNCNFIFTVCCNAWREFNKHAKEDALAIQQNTIFVGKHCRLIGNHHPTVKMAVAASCCRDLFFNRDRGVGKSSEKCFYKVLTNGEWIQMNILIKSK